MAEERLSDEHCNLVRKSLNLSSSRLPFELTEEELSYGPDDWAWLFLRLNTDYQASYKTHASDEEEDLSHALIGRQAPGIKPDHDGTCAIDFGLGAWIPPCLKSLPPLKYENDSWFFPLKRPIAEDYRRTEVSALNYKRAWSCYSPQLDTYPHILSNETQFGYRMPPSVPSPILDIPRKTHSQRIRSLPSFDASTLSLIWVAIDCSIPPPGQLLALTNLARVVRDALRAEGWKSKKNIRNIEIHPVDRSDAFAHMVFQRSERATEKVSSHQDVWRAVMIDSLAPIGHQMQSLLKDLWKIHRGLILEGLVQKPNALRFKNTLSVSRRNGEGGTQVTSSGSYLKALHILAQLSQQGYTDLGELAQIIGLRSASDRYVGSWALHFDADIEQHICDSQRMINGGYRLLIHEQNPKT